MSAEGAELRRAPLPLGLLLPRRGVGAGGAGTGGGRAGLSGPRPDRPRRRLGGDGVRAGVQVVRRAPDRRRRADRDCRGRSLSPDAPRRGRHRVAEPVPPGHGGSSRYASAAGPGAPPSSRFARPRSSSGRRAWSASRAARAMERSRGASASGAYVAHSETAPRTAAGEAMTLGRRLVDAFGRDRFRVELQRPFWRSDRARNRWLEDLAGRLGVRCVATGDVHMHDPSRAPLQDALVAVRLKGTLEETEPGRRGNASAHLAAPATMAARFGEHPGAVAETARIAERLGFDLTRDLGYRYPGSEDPDADRTLAEICRARLDHRYAGEPEHREGTATAGGGARGDPLAAAVWVLPAPLRHPRAGARGGGRGQGAGFVARRSCPRAGAAARASARSSATSPGSRMSTRCATGCSWGAS